jgi:hypothetical protein
MNELDQSKLWYQTDLDVFLNRWYANYEDARQSLERDGGFLLPYKHHFFICQPDVISALGLDPAHADWQKIGRDCARPRELAAYERLRRLREDVVRARLDAYQRFNA